MNASLYWFGGSENVVGGLIWSASSRELGTRGSRPTHRPRRSRCWRLTSARPTRPEGHRCVCECGSGVRSLVPSSRLDARTRSSHRLHSLTRRTSTAMRHRLCADVNGDGWVDEIVSGFPGQAASWREIRAARLRDGSSTPLAPTATSESPASANLGVSSSYRTLEDLLVRAG